MPSHVARKTKISFKQDQSTFSESTDQKYGGKTSESEVGKQSIYQFHTRL